MKNAFHFFMIAISYFLTNVCFYFFCYCYQLHVYRGEGYANIKNLNSKDYISYFIFFFIFSLLTTILLYIFFRNLKKSILNFMLHIGVVFMLNYSMCLTIPIFSFFYDDWNKLVFSIWNESIFILNIFITIFITIILYLFDIKVKTL